MSGRPSRTPGEGLIELEPMAGDLQLTRPRVPGTGPENGRPAGARVATDEQRQTIYGPTERVPVSGVYDVVDREGGYLRHQVTCHQGDEFPPTRDHVVKGRRYGYRLAFEAAHLTGDAGAAEHAETVRLPGTPVGRSGVYGLVDRGGTYLHHQKACVAGESFPPTEGLGPDAFGYVLQYEARHLSRG